MTRGRGRWLIATASAAVALGATPAWGAAAESSPTGQTGPGPSAAPEVPLLRPEEELLLEVRTDEWILEQAFAAYSTPTGSYIPLGAFTRLLDMAILIDGDTGRGEGWFLDEKNSFRIDVNAGFVEVRGERKPLRPSDAVATLGDIFVRTAKLAEWFPLEAKIDLPKQQVQLKLLETFPFEARIEREQTRENLGFRPAAARISYPREETIYAMMTTPALDINMRGTAGTEQATTSQYDVRMSGDLAFMNADLFFGGDHRKPLQDARLTLRRRDPDGELLGPLGLTLVELGDTSSGQLTLGPRSRTGRGFAIGNIPLDRESVFDKIDLRGELPIGYEVELYRNDVLIDSVHTPVDGRYEFLQVPLEFGLNLLRLVFYGPHGERREEIRQINAGEGRLSPGEFQFAASAVQQDENLIPIGRDDDSAGSFLAKGAIRAIASAQYGLSSRITAVGGLASFVTDGDRHMQGMAGIRTNLGASAIQLDGAYQGSGAWALQTGIAGRLLGASYVLQHAEYGSAFVDELRGGVAGAYKRYTQLRLDRGFNLGDRTLATNLVAERSERPGATEWIAALRTSTSLNRWLVSNAFAYRRTDGAGSSNQSLDGAFEVNGVLANMGVRAGIDYELKPSARLRTLNVSIDRDLGGTLVRAIVSRELSQGKAMRAGLSLSRRFGAFDMGGDVQYDTETKALVVGIRSSFSFGRGLGGWRVAPPGLARGGSVLATVFRDLDGDGVKGPGDPALEGIGFRGGFGEVKTDESGHALVSGLGDGRPAQVTMLGYTLPDPYMAPVKPGIEVVPRPGRTHVAMFAVATVSEVEGTAVFRGSDSEQPVSNVQLQLVDAAGEVVASAKTEYDGYFFLERVPPGKYELRIDPEQAGKLGISLAAAIPVEAGLDGGLVGDIDVTIVRAAAPALAAN